MARKEIIYYRIPDQYWYRLHFVRPRFKSNIEYVLLYMANECCKIPKLPCKEYSKRYYEAIRMFPGNIDMADKTLHNWRTEIPALFGFYKEDKELDITETSPMAKFLHDNQDLTQFLRLFLFYFQFPGGHMKPQDLKDIIHSNIRFKPARTIIQVLMAGNGILNQMNSEKEMSISAEEATYCIFNDIRVTSGAVSVEAVAKTILDNRKNKIRYYNPNDEKTLSLTGHSRSKGDMIRYAGDILDYMETANLLEKHHGYFSLKANEANALNTFAKDTGWFNGYDSFYGKNDIETRDLSKVEPDWFEYVNKSMNPQLFKTDLRSIIGDNAEIDVVFDERIADIVTSEDKTTKDIGNLGEAIICGHEKMRLKLNGYDAFIRFVQVVDSPTYHPGFDIDSFEADGTEEHRYIEVKTTISKQKIQMYGFHMSPNEWRVAATIKDHYCVYRLMLSKTDKILFILRNPVDLYKKDRIEAEPHDGMEITFSTDNFKPTKLLTWKR